MAIVLVIVARAIVVFPWGVHFNRAEHTAAPACWSSTGAVMVYSILVQAPFSAAVSERLPASAKREPGPTGN